MFLQVGQRVVYYHTPTGQFSRGAIKTLEATVVADTRRAMVTIKVDGEPKPRRVFRDSVELAEVADV